jgi:hypothetical protein
MCPKYFVSGFLVFAYGKRYHNGIPDIPRWVAGQKGEAFLFVKDDVLAVPHVACELRSSILEVVDCLEPTWGVGVERIKQARARVQEECED